MSRKLTDQQKIDMVEKYLTGNYNCAELGKEYGITRHNINQLLRRRNIPIYNNRSELNRRYCLDEHCFDEINTEYSAYWLGFLYADGYNNEQKGIISLFLAEEDYSMIVEFSKFVKSNKPISIKKSKITNHQDMCGTDIFSANMSSQLAKLGCFQKKSLTLKFPTEEQVPSHLIHHFIRGYFDGDGCACIYHGKNERNNTRARITSSIYFCEKLIEKIILETNIHLSLSKISINKNPLTRTASTTGNKKTEKFLDWLYKDATIYLERKHAIYLEIKQLMS